MAFLKDSFKKSGAEYDKAHPPGHTLAWVKDRLRDFGTPLLEEVARIDRGRLGIPVFASRYTPHARRITGSQKQMGKGVTAHQAEASAVMELVERFSVFSYHALSRPYGTMGEMGAEAVRAEELLKSFGEDWSGSRERRALAGIMERLPLDWVRAFDPAGGRMVLVPWTWFWTINEYNGSAAGNTLEEAAVQALCEVVERHVCSMVTAGARPVPTIDPGTLKNPMARSLMDCYGRAGVKIVLKDFTMGMGIPTVAAIAWDPATFPERSEIVYTAGTAPHPERAVIRALTEIAQLAGDFDTDGKYLECALPKFPDLAGAEPVMASPEVVSIRDLPSVDSENFREEIERASSALKSVGYPSYLVDITHSRLGVPCAYAIMPGNRFRDRTDAVDCISHVARLAADGPDPETALSLLGSLDDAFPGRADLLFYRGTCHEKSGDNAGAISWYRKAAASASSPPELANIHCNIGNCLKEIGDYPAACRELERALELAPGLKEACNLLGFCRFRMGKHMEAIEAFERAISIDPGSALDYANIASNLRMLGMVELARHWYSMALELDPDISWARQHLEDLRDKK